MTGEYLPAQTVIAAHLYKHEWREYAEADIGLLDIDDAGNGLLLWKPLEYAFDTSALSFIYDKTTERYVSCNLQSRAPVPCQCLPVAPWG